VITDESLYLSRNDKMALIRPFHGEATMPEFTTVSVTEAKLRTTSGRQKTFLQEYIAYIQQLPKDQAGRLRGGEQENPLTIRRRLITAANALGINIIIKRSRNDLYFWQEYAEEEPRTKRRYTRRAMGREETTAPDQPFSASDEVDYGASREESPELGQTDQVVEDAMRRLDPE
jgi:hypothetical protein